MSKTPLVLTLLALVCFSILLINSSIFLSSGNQGGRKNVKIGMLAVPKAMMTVENNASDAFKMSNIIASHASIDDARTPEKSVLLHSGRDQGSQTHAKSAVSNAEDKSSDSYKWLHQQAFQWPSNVAQFLDAIIVVNRSNFFIQYSSVIDQELPLNYQHHWTLKLAKILAPAVHYDPDHWVDFFGVKTDVNFDFLLSSSPAVWLRHTAQEHKLLGQKYKKGDVLPSGLFPDFDQDYIDFTETLTLIYAFCFDEKEQGPFVYIEAGANYGVWAIRVAVYIRHLCPWKSFFVIAAEYEPQKFKNLQMHLRNNGILESHYRIESKFVGIVTDAEHISLVDLMLPFKKIHVLNLDCQGAERDIMQDRRSIDLIQERVMFVQLENHFPDLDALSTTLFQMIMFKPVKTWMWPSDCNRAVHFQTPFGPVKFCQSLFAYFNYRMLDNPWTIVASALM
jgi:hypothetical protein